MMNRVGDMDELTFGRWLNARRRERGFSREEFARRAGFRDAFEVNDLEHDRIDPRPLVDIIAATLGEDSEEVSKLASAYERNATVRSSARREIGETMLAFRRARGDR